MNDSNLPICCAIFFLGLMGAATAAPVEIVGTLQNVEREPLSGQILVFREVPRLSVTQHSVGESGQFRISSDSEGGLVIYATAERHPADERVIPSGTSGIVSLHFVLPSGQDAEGRVVDAEGNGVPNAVVQVRYYEPHKPVRRVSFGEDELTDEDGRFLIRDVGVRVPFLVDVLAPDYPPISSERMLLEPGSSQMEEIVLGERGAEVVVELIDAVGLPVPDVGVTLLADPAGLPADARGSWLHHQGFRQKAIASAAGVVRFSGVPPGRVIARVRTAAGVARRRAVAVSNRELHLVLKVAD